MTGNYSIHSGAPFQPFVDGKFALGDDSWWHLRLSYYDSQFGDDSGSIALYNSDITGWYRLESGVSVYPTVLTPGKITDGGTATRAPLPVIDIGDLLGLSMSEHKEDMASNNYGPNPDGSYRCWLRGWESYGENSHGERYGHDNMWYNAIAFKVPQCVGKKACVRFSISNFTDTAWTFCKGKSNGTQASNEKWGLDVYEVYVGWGYLGCCGMQYWYPNNPIAIGSTKGAYRIRLQNTKPQCRSDITITAPFTGKRTYDIKGTGPGALYDDMGIMCIYLTELWPHLDPSGGKDKWSDTSTNAHFTLGDIYVYYEDSPRTGAANETYIEYDNATGEGIPVPRRF